MSLLGALPWWAFGIGAALSGFGAALLAFLALSAGTAYGTEYHALSETQRRMARLLTWGAIGGALGCALLALALGAWALHRVA